jgi:hypothetical protein
MAAQATTLPGNLDWRTRESSGAPEVDMRADTSQDETSWMARLAVKNRAYWKSELEREAIVERTRLQPPSRT